MENPTEQKKKYYERFDAYSRFLHILVIISFILLAITGMTIKFAGVGIFQAISQLMGGYVVTGFLHRVGAVITFVYFGLHIAYLIRKMRKRKVKLFSFLKGQNSLIPNINDLKELSATMKWFVGKGPRPQYGRWTYWEKFDYWAVFWGIAVIGSSGLLLWFPEFFTMLGLPGEVINIATIIHSDEALLAVGFIFTYHFFNTHFRPDKFPMDTVIFTGKVELEELKEDRPKEYESIINDPELQKRIGEAPPHFLERASRIFGFSALVTGIILVLLIIYSMIFLYQ